MGFAALSYAMLGAAWNVWIFLLSRVPVGIFRQSLTMARAMVTDRSKNQEDDLRELSVVNNISFVAGPLIGGYLAEYTCYEVCCGASSLLLLGDAVVCWYYVDPCVLNGEKKEKKGEHPEKKKHIIKSFVDIVNWKLSMVVFFNVVSSAASAIWLSQYFIGVKALGTSMAGVMRSIASLTSALSVRSRVRLSERVIGFALCFCLFLLLVQKEDSYLALVMIMPLSGFGALFHNANIARLTNVAPSSHMGTVLGTEDALGMAVKVSDVLFFLIIVKSFSSL